MRETRDCYVCGKTTDLLKLLVGEHLYCSLDCFNAEEERALSSGLFRLVDCANILRDHLSEHRTPNLERALRTIEQAQEHLCRNKKWKENQVGLKKLGTKN